MHLLKQSRLPLFIMHGQRESFKSRSQLKKRSQEIAIKIKCEFQTKAQVPKRKLYRFCIIKTAPL